MQAIMAHAIAWNGHPSAEDISSAEGRGAVIGALARGITTKNIEAWPVAAANIKNLNMITQRGWVERFARRHSVHIDVLRSVLASDSVATEMPPVSVDRLLARRRKLRAELDDLNGAIMRAVEEVTR
jgi:hypothetical protein